MRAFEETINYGAESRILSLNRKDKEFDWGNEYVGNQARAWRWCANENELGIQLKEAVGEKEDGKLNQQDSRLAQLENNEKAKDI